MKLNLRNLDSGVILHVTGDVAMRDAEILVVGILKVVNDDLPLILDFEHCTFSERGDEKLKAAFETLEKKEIEYYIVSPSLPNADAPSLVGALAMAEFPDTQALVEILQLERELEQLTERQDALIAKAGGDVGQNADHRDMVRINNTYKWLIETTKQNIAKDTVLYQKFSAAVDKTSPDIPELKTQKKEVLLMMETKGVSLGRT